MKFTFYLLSLFSCFSYVSSYNYLIVNPIYGFSHVKFMTKVANTLASGGHNVTLLQYYHTPMSAVKSLVRHKNVEVIDYWPSHIKETDTAEENTFPDIWDSTFFSGAVSMMFDFVTMWERTSREVLQDSKLHNQLKSKKFDGIVIEAFEISGFYLGHILEIPATISVLSMVRLPMDNRFGQASVLGYVPSEWSELPNKAGFIDRLIDVFFFQSGSILFESFMTAQHKMHARSLEGRGNVPHWTKLFAKSPVYITNSDPYLDFATPSSGNVVPIGGLTINIEKEVSKLPVEYDKLLNERRQTVFISFGSVVRSFQMPENFKSSIIEMCKNLPNVTFIWKYEIEDDVEFNKRLPSNLYIRKWVNQPALLLDDRIALFVTHGGLSSTMEVAYSGKPTLLIPLFGDQPMNARMLERHGGSAIFKKHDLANSQKLTASVLSMITDEKYKKNALQFRDVLHSQPIKPKELLLKHMEFAVKFPNLKSQIAEINQANFIGFYYLDAFLFIFVLSSLLLYVVFKLIFAICRKFISIVIHKKTKLE